MNKKIVYSIILTFFITVAFTLGAICLLLGINSATFVDCSRFFVAFRFIETSYVQEVEPRKLIDGAISGMINSLGDPHSIYLNPELYSQLKAQTSGSFGGIGVYMGFKNNSVQVMSVIPDSPSAKAGILADDEIIAVDGKPVTEIPANEIAMKIRGEIGTSVELSILRNGAEKLSFNLTRENIDIQTVAGQMIDNRLGYIKIANFSENTGDDFNKTLTDLENNELKGLVLDLRENPGGLITSCIDIAKKIVPKGVITSVIQRDGSKVVYSSDATPTFPIVVLIDKNSASASELLAGALQDTHAAQIVGQTSYGKGSVQTLIPMAHDDGMKITIAKYYTPNGRCIDGAGISPDVEVPASVVTVQSMYNLNLNANEDASLAKAIDILNSQINSGKILFN